MEQSHTPIFSAVKGDLTLLLVTAIGEYAFSRVAYALTAGFRWGYLVESTASMRAAATTVSAWAGIQLVTLWLIYRAVTEADHVREPLAEAVPRLEQRIAQSLRNLRGCMVLSPVLAVIEFALAGTTYILLALAFCLLGYLIFALGCRRLRHSLSALLSA